MNPDKSFKNFNKINDVWLGALEQYSFEDLKRKPSETQWSLGQLYNHLVIINKIILQQIELCVGGKGTYTKEQKGAAKFILFINMLPPMKYRVPDVISHTPPQLQNHEEIKEKFRLVSLHVSQLLEKVKAADPNQKIAHPSMGFLSAQNWFQFLSIHMKHHLRQKAKLDKLIVS